MNEIGAHFSSDTTNLGVSMQLGLAELVIYPREGGSKALRFRLSVGQTSELCAALQEIAAQEENHG